MIRNAGRRTAALVVPLSILLSGCTDDSEGGPTSAANDTHQHLTGHSDPLAPGTYQFSFVTAPGLETPDALVDVPSGFIEGEDGYDWYVVSPDGDTFLGLWTVTRVDRDACRDEESDAFDPGPSVEDLAQALVAQKSTHASTPEPVTLAGHPGLYVELASPRDFSTCGKVPGLWRDPERGIYGDGQVDRLWILDVDGQRVVVDASYGLQATAVERDDLTSMVESLTFVPAAQG